MASAVFNPLEQRDFLPNFCGNRTVFLIVLTAQILAFVLAIVTAGTGEGFWLNLALYSLFVQWVALSSTVVLCGVSGLLARFGVVLKTLIAYFITQASTIGASFAAQWVTGFRGPVLSTSGWYFISRNLIVSSIVCLVLLRYFYLQHQWRINVQAESESRLKALQARIRPHFLFNSLNTVASLLYSEPTKAEQTLLDLSDLFRSNLRQRDRVELTEEVELAKRYLNIEQIRLGDRLRVEWHIAEDAPMDLLIPPLILQPLLENAVFHGIEPRVDGGSIEITLSSTRRKLVIAVENALPQQAPSPQGRSNSMAQDNIRQRLELAYSDEAKMRIEPTEKSYRVTLTIPLQVES